MIRERREPLFRLLASAVSARLNCERSGRKEGYDRWTDLAEKAVYNLMPSGSGFDQGTTLDFDASDASKLVFVTAFHHMHDGGFYDGWTEHKVTVRPDWDGISVQVSGRDRNEIKDYIAEAFSIALQSEVVHSVDPVDSTDDVNNAEWMERRMVTAGFDAVSLGC